MAGMEGVEREYGAYAGGRMESMLGLMGCERPSMMAGVALLTVWLEHIQGVKGRGAPLLLPSIAIFLERGRCFLCLHSFTQLAGKHDREIWGSPGPPSFSFLKE